MNGDARDDIPPWRLWAAPVAIVVGFLLAELLTLIVYGVGASQGASTTNPTPAMEIVGSVVFDVGFIVAALLMAQFSGGVRAPWFGFRRVRVRTTVVAVVLAAVAYYVLTDLYASLFALHAKDNLPSGFGLHRSDWAIVGTALFVCAIAPMCEETFFRGFLFGVLRRLPLRVGTHELGPWVAAVIVAILFGLAHTGSANPEYLIPLGFLGFMLCLVRWRTRSLYPGMILHSGNNAVALAVQLHWSVGAAAALAVGSWLVIAAVAGPVGARHRALA